jgi:hypothetical protein
VTQIPYCYLEKKNHQIATQIFLHSFLVFGEIFTSFFFTKMEPINFESIFGMMANDPEKAQHEAKPVTYALNTSK